MLCFQYASDPDGSKAREFPLPTSRPCYDGPIPHEGSLIDYGGVNHQVSEVFFDYDVPQCVTVTVRVR